MMIIPLYSGFWNWLIGKPTCYFMANPPELADKPDRQIYQLEGYQPTHAPDPCNAKPPRGKSSIQQSTT